jgi:capsular polysaccharide transport system permease protein
MLALHSHFQVLRAVIIRDLMVRFGRNNLGFVWTVLEPMILTTGVMLMWSMIKEPIIHGVPVVTFVLTGYMPLTLWRHLTNPMQKLLRSNFSLLYHQRVTHVHIMLARMALEFLSTSTALIVVYFVVTTTGMVHPIEDYGLAMAAWLFTGWYFGATGLLIGSLTEVWEPAERFIPALQYLALPISGVFFMIDWVPSYAQKLLLLNPSVHCFEMFRAGFLGSGAVTHYDPVYLGVACTLVTIAGVASVYHIRDRIQFQ